MYYFVRAGVGGGERAECSGFRWSNQKIFHLFLDNLEHIPDLNCVLELEWVLVIMNAFMIFNVLFKFFSFPFHSNRSNIYKNAFYALILFSARWDCSWSFHSFLWKNNHSLRTTPSPNCHHCNMCAVIFMEWCVINRFSPQKNYG